MQSLLRSRYPSTCEPAEDPTIANIVDTARYPIHELDGTQAAATIAKARAAWETYGEVSLPGFIRADVRALLADEVSGLPAHNRRYTAPYLARKSLGSNASLDPEHPLRRLFQSDIHAVAGDQIPNATLLRRVYDSPAVAAFFARVIRRGRLYHYADGLQQLNVMYLLDRGGRSWHYDGSDFVATLMVQQADEGGDFDFAPFIRTRCGGGGGDAENFARVRELFDGAYAGRRTTRAEAGTVQLFNGCRSLHRVRTAFGPTARITAVLSYDSNPPCAQQLPSLEANVRNYGERVRDSAVWLRAQEERRRLCAGVESPPPFETEG
mmetsp:Transcript_29983/g.99441  ORF Transcript_29983/g.99441 Transcript_29983/m.99441 type:complete len:323 (-) Transcript_29983:136-1104(-)